MEGMKELFRNVLQQVMDGELEAQLGYDKSQRSKKEAGDTVSKNYRNGYFQKESQNAAWRSGHSNPKGPER